MGSKSGRLRLKCDGTRAEIRFRLSAKRKNQFKSVGVSVQSTTGSRGVCISGSNGSNAGYTMFRGSVKGTDYPLHSPVSPSLPLPCVTVCHHVSTALYCRRSYKTHHVPMKTYHPLRPAFFWVITQRVVGISYRRFGTTYRSHLQGYTPEEN